MTGYHMNRDTPPPVRDWFANPLTRRRDYIIVGTCFDRLTILRIQRLTAEHFEIPFREMTSSRRAREVARPRQVAMYLCKHHTRHSLPEIGRRFGRDHTTVIHAIRQITKLRAEDPEFDAKVAELEGKL